MLMEGPSYGLGNVRNLKWTSKLNVFNLDKVIICKNDNNTHWFRAVENFRRGQTHWQVFDSMLAVRQTMHDNLHRWLKDVCWDQTRSELDTIWWVGFPPSQWSRDKPARMFVEQGCAGRSLGNGSGVCLASGRKQDWSVPVA